MKVALIVDPLVTTMGAVRPAILLSRRFLEMGDEPTIITPRHNARIGKTLEAGGIEVKDVGPRSSLVVSFPTFDAWIRRLFRKNAVGSFNEYDIVINTSSCIVAQAHVYYAQGLMSRALYDIQSSMPLPHRFGYALLGEGLHRLERMLVREFRASSRLFVSNSKFCGEMYERWKIKVDGNISPPLDCSLFKSSTSRPAGDYVLTHLGTYGKEGDFLLVKALADSGVRLKVFGRTSFLPRSVREHPNIHFAGKVTDPELVDLYSNALFTLFAFKHEPFGYIPVESMACMTPVLTYNKQGPAETVVNGKTGWLEDNGAGMIVKGLILWKRGYDSTVRKQCRERALLCDTGRIGHQWKEVIETLK
jgi:glycosyltransferase involved in cell wall biosynthesis